MGCVFFIKCVLINHRYKVYRDITEVKTNITTKNNANGEITKIMNGRIALAELLS